jgi:hypothetical protein
MGGWKRQNNGKDWKWAWGWNLKLEKISKVQLGNLGIVLHASKVTFLIEKIRLFVHELALHVLDGKKELE